MQALILSAGQGKRMGELTANTPKPLLKIGDTTLIENNIQQLNQAGITDIVINIYYLSEKIIKALSKYSIKFSIEKKQLESGGGIVNAMELLADTFIIINADILHNYNLKQLKLPKKSLAHLILVDNPEHNTKGDFNFKNEKLTFSGIGIYSKKLFKNYQVDYLKLGQVLYDNLDKISFEKHSDYWLDVGTPQRLKLANTYYSSNKNT